MADKDGKCDLAIAPGQVYVEVEYDYEYKAKDRLITIKQGECYILLRKTNEDWWQVKKDENTKPFYVPAQYVREVRKALMPPQKPLYSGALVKAKPDMLDIHPLQKSNENLAKAPEMTSFGRPAPGPVTPPAPPRDANQNLGSPVQSKSLAEHFLNNNNIGGAAGSLLGGRADSPPPPPRPPNHSRSPAAGRKPPLDLEADRTPPHCDSAGEGSEKHRQDSESGDELSSSSTEHLQLCRAAERQGDFLLVWPRRLPSGSLCGPRGENWRLGTCLPSLGSATGIRPASPREEKGSARLEGGPWRGIGKGSPGTGGSVVAGCWRVFCRAGGQAPGDHVTRGVPAAAERPRFRWAGCRAAAARIGLRSGAVLTRLVGGLGCSSGEPPADEEKELARIHFGKNRTQEVEFVINPSVDFYKGIASRRMQTVPQYHKYTQLSAKIEKSVHPSPVLSVITRCLFTLNIHTGEYIPHYHSITTPNNHKTGCGQTVEVLSSPTVRFTVKSKSGKKSPIPGHILVGCVILVQWTASPTGPGRPESPVYTNLQELKISQAHLPPAPSGSPLHTLGDWETYKDPSGRHFYFNRATQERTWKPPRARDASSSGSTSSSRGEGHAPGDPEPLSSEENCHSTYSSQSDSQYGSPPRGWSEELDEHGHTLYVSEYTNEKWIKHVDDQGRPYYYSADGSRSEWELPKYNLSPPQPGDMPKSRSLDRKQVEPIVLTKWRHSTYVADLSDKESPTGPKQSFPDSDSCPSSPKHPTATSEKCGVLNVTKITENGKKVRKNWTSSWAVLQGFALLFAKGQGGGTGWSYYRRGSIPELLLSLLSNWKRSVKQRPAVSYVYSGPVTAATRSPVGLFLGGDARLVYELGMPKERCNCGVLEQLDTGFSARVKGKLGGGEVGWMGAKERGPAWLLGRCFIVPAALLLGEKFGGNQSKPEFTVDLRGASVDWASKDKSSKKHVIELKTRQGTELLIQSENDSVITDWYKALAETISTHAWESDEAIEEDMPESPRPEKQDKDKEKDKDKDKEKEKDKDKEHRDSKKGRVMKTSTSMDSSDQKKTRVKLRKFLTRRPTLQAVRDKGYIKDQVFGCSLTSLCQRENTTVPTFVKMCIDHVENKGLSVDGLYRVSGNLAVIQKLRFAVNHDEKVNLEDSKWEDIHVTTGALKMFFRELPEPLFTHAYFEDFVSAIKCPDYKQRVHSIKDLIKQLPKPNQDTMQVLFKHLRRRILQSAINNYRVWVMLSNREISPLIDWRSVAIVFGPTLLRPEKETGNIAVHMVYQNQIVELILLEYESIFSR
ncbi:RHG12 protein, partial [Atractosteus spatula]|nr:RHG12 protein [Atractosteus spatula]